ncbi:MAG: SCO family protein [Actinomycetota bacterium]
MTSRTKAFITIGVGMIVILLVAWQFILPRLQPHVFYGQVIQSTSPAPTIELDGPGGERVAISDFEDKVVVLYFGYTFCPDVCPISLAKLARAREMMGDKGDDVQVIMVSVDPARDTWQVLEEYAAHFDETFIGLTGDPADIDRIATVYGVYYEAEESTSSAGYLVNHTSTVMVVDRNGELKLVIPYEATDEQVAADLSYLVG